jgi:hypothetical protein
MFDGDHLKDLLAYGSSLHISQSYVCATLVWLLSLLRALWRLCCGPPGRGEGLASTPNFRLDLYSAVINKNMEQR